MYLKYLSVILMNNIVVLTRKSEKINISIIYTALCPDSIGFLVNEYYPTYLQLREYMQVELLPYGKAEHEFDKNKWKFYCQFGPQDCLADKYHVCALKNEYIDEGQKFNFIYCILRKKRSEFQECSKSSNISWKSIQKCVSRNGKGDEYMADIGDRTQALQPTVDFVPTILIDGEYNIGEQSKAFKNFKNVLCKRIEYKLTCPKPVPCALDNDLGF